MEKTSKFLSPVLSIVLGILLLVFKGDVVSIALTVLGVVFLVMGIMDIVNKQITLGIVRMVIGAAIIVFGWLLLSVALYVIAVFLIIAGIYGIYKLLQKKSAKALDYLQPILLTVVGLCLFFNQGGTVAWVFIVVGIILIVQGIVGLLNVLKK